ncbi:LytTR family DNA-binding domain-containing protein [Candidatus Enterococcus murrayae]|uniref:LytTR family transcriptional regulator n=1 Tax=Candidatus Enterococcus murrayae TaxID=2815321 RepID=A0ABS3HL92_9ENTE|nr:LytTR family DNA-binding domain-containing protein [Enterococcus sp. MJM16]MBO0454213.1 LytTR family transcriptional regulator [Enterococcus sp. MJM16]
MKAPIILETKTGTIIIQATELLYITVDDTKDHSLCFVTKKGTHYCTGDLNNYEDADQNWLFRCHRSFVVNLLTIREINKYERRVYFLDDSSNNNCPFSRRKYVPLKQSLKEILFTEQEAL